MQSTLIVTLIVAVVGVAGTLLSPLVQAWVGRKDQQQRDEEARTRRFDDSKRVVFVGYLRARSDYLRTCEKLYLQGEVSAGRAAELNSRVRIDGAEVKSLELEIGLLAPAVFDTIETADRAVGPCPRRNDPAAPVPVIDDWARRYAESTDNFREPMRSDLGIPT